jgi:hypothetical protein
VLQAFNLSANTSLVSLVQGGGVTLSGDLTVQRVLYNTSSSVVILQNTELETTTGATIELGW